MKVSRKEIENKTDEEFMDDLETMISGIVLMAEMEDDFPKALKAFESIEAEIPDIKEWDFFRQAKAKVKKGVKTQKLMEEIFNGDFSFQKIRNNILNRKNNLNLVLTWVSKISEFALEEFTEEIQELLSDLESARKKHFPIIACEIMLILNGQKINHQFKVRDLLINPKLWTSPFKTKWFRESIALIKKQFKHEKEIGNLREAFFITIIKENYLFNSDILLERNEKGELIILSEILNIYD